jgi:hypothetical protein
MAGWRNEKENGGGASFLQKKEVENDLFVF